jgi:tetratricopeptide (TPR) repeat protein
VTALSSPSAPPVTSAPLPPQHYSNQLLACLNQDNLAEAEANARRIAAQSPQDGWAFDALGLILVKTKKYEDAMAAFEMATRASNAAPQFFLHHAMCLLACFRHKTALTVIESAYHRWSNIADICFAYARILAQCFQQDAARAIYKTVLSEDAHHSNRWVAYVHDMLSLGLTTDVLDGAAKAIALDTANYTQVGLVYFRTLAAMGRNTKAKYVRDQCIARLRTNPRTIVKAIDWIERNEGIEIAEPLWREEVQKVGPTADAIFHLAQNLAMQGRWTEAATLAQQALQHTPGEALQLQTKILLRSANHYAPRIAQWATAPPDIRRKPSPDMIVIRGGLERRFLDIVKHYRAAHPGVFIILSIWTDTAPDLLNEIEPYIDDVVLNVRPPRPGMNNLNFQIVCAANGIQRAKELGAERVFLTRTDIAFLKPELIKTLREMLGQDQPDVAKTPGLQKRIIISDLYSLLHPFYHASDIFCYGTVDDVAKLWSLDHITDACLRPEVILCRGLAAKVGRELKNDIFDSLSAFRDLFIVRDAESLQLYWPKYPALIRSRLLDTRAYVSEGVWRGTEMIDLEVSSDVLPSYTP